MLDERDRANNVIITGVAEEPDTMGDTDLAKAMNIFGKLDIQGSEDTINTRRLGKLIEGRTRVLLVSFSQKDQRQDVLKSAKRLKEAGESYSNVYIKKDMHPGIRKELNRLRKVEKQEKEKAANQGKDIKFDHKQRTVSIDGVVIDRFKPSFF